MDIYVDGTKLTSFSGVADLAAINPKSPIYVSYHEGDQTSPSVFDQWTATSAGLGAFPELAINSGLRTETEGFIVFNVLSTLGTYGKAQSSIPLNASTITVTNMGVFWPSSGPYWYWVDSECYPIASQVTPPGVPWVLTEVNTGASLCAGTSARSHV